MYIYVLYIVKVVLGMKYLYMWVISFKDNRTISH